MKILAVHSQNLFVTCSHPPTQENKRKGDDDTAPFASTPRTRSIAAQEHVRSAVRTFTTRGQYIRYDRLRSL
jgi:hypothetical protein